MHAHKYADKPLNICYG